MPTKLSAVLCGLHFCNIITQPESRKLLADGERTDGVQVIGENGTRQCWILKCDIRKFFASIDHAVLIGIIRDYTADEKLLTLLEEIIGSFSSTGPGVGLPLGNLTSQLFVNIYMNEFDQFAKHKLKAKYYMLHPKKISIETIYSGVDFLGWIHFSDHRVLRTATAHRMVRNLKSNPKDETVQSYSGLLSHGNAKKLAKKYLTKAV